LSAAAAGSPGVRIGGGERRGLKLRVPAGIRPTSGRLREALFDIWSWRVAGCTFLDLFAGSGAVGIEAASRGAARVVLVEGDRSVLTVLRSNQLRAGLPSVEIVQADLPGGLERSLPVASRFDLIFADPPYGFDASRASLAAAARRLADGGEIAFERRWTDPDPIPPDGFLAVDSRRYGESGLSFLRRIG
jgi:16S rRNA (guanine966-N2)-methyltransferase